ncbi:MAG: hypothetical protein HFJ20_03255 [Clostridia bacterium]|nr:hypothetical protein [Clostridia bacterium]
MQIIKEQFQTVIVGKCLEKEDILQLWKFGFSKENIAKKYAEDNKIKIAEARKVVIKFLYEEVTNDNRKNNTRCKSE